ncbi:lipocalin family protein [Paenibacillus kribbensis]|uniref:lipocalin family protein n=1 Tax=Paenibacillus kribbensis TaxID=172713 RepID=UPI002DBA166E|nr:lipocalin family protein [Paenibacillus kribbensis]MEC0232799.1 lipocalin family protein [Paenibacillus kribbensis]
MVNHKKIPLTENVKTSSLGLLPELEPTKDLIFKPEYDCNSWWAGGLFESEGHKITYVFHIMTTKVPQMGTVKSYRLTFSDVTTGWYCDTGEQNFQGSELNIAEDAFKIEVPNGIISGDLDHMEIHMTGENCAVNVTMKAMGYPLYNGGAGTFQWQGTKSHQYSIPNMDTKGTLTLDGKEYRIEGNSWFDRQWQMSNPASLLSLKWGWMCYNLDNGDIISVWTNTFANHENSWATIMHPDGTQTVTYAKPLSQGIKKYWRSEASGKKYPVEWKVELPDINSEFEVSTFPVNQEMVSPMPVPGSCFEGISTVKGTYKGEKIEGYCFVEITGRWEEECERANATEA